MALPHNALVLVTDGRKMLFLRNHGDENQIDLRTEAHDEREDRKDHEIKTDAPGDQAERRLLAARPRRRPTSTSRRRTAGPRTPPTSSTSARCATTSMRWRSSPRPRRWACSARNCTRRSSGGSSHAPKEMTGRPIPDIEELLVGEATRRPSRRSRLREEVDDLGVARAYCA